MATANDGTNPGRAGQPQRQSPGQHRNGRGTNIDDAQVPGTIFGQSTALGSTGLPGSAKRRDGMDVTEQSDQTYEGISGQTVSHDQTTLAGSAGAHPQGGGESVTYTDPFGIQGGVNREVTTHGDISTWTEASNPYGSSTLPGVAGNQPKSTGLGHGRIRGAGKGL